MKIRVSLLSLLSVALFPSSGLAAIWAYYPFDSDILDASGNDNHLVGPAGGGTAGITNTAGEHMFGGGAADFNSTTGNQVYYDLTTSRTFGAGEAWSVSFWARHRPGNDGRTGMIVGDRTNASDFIWIPRDGAVDGIRFRNSGGGNADYTTPPAGVEPAGVYHHFALIADGAGSIEVYYDNVSLGTRSLATTFSITSVGQAFTSNVQTMNGQIDELYIFDEAIDANTVNALFTNTIPEPSSALLVALGGLALMRRRRTS